MTSTLPRFSVRPSFPSSSLREEPEVVLATPEDVFRYFKRTILRDPTFEPQKEHVIVIALDARQQVIGYNVVSVGTYNECLLSIGETLRPVIVAGSSRFFLIHNHPSGITSPSAPDRVLTKKMQEACKLLDIRFLDHVIVGDTTFHSFQELGLLH